MCHHINIRQHYILLPIILISIKTELLRSKLPQTDTLLLPKEMADCLKQKFCELLKGSFVKAFTQVPYEEYFFQDKFVTRYNDKG